MKMLLKKIIFPVLTVFYCSCHSNMSDTNNIYIGKDRDKSFIKDFLIETEFIRGIVFLEEGKMDFKVLQYVEKGQEFPMEFQHLLNGTYKKEWKGLNTEDIGEVITEYLKEKECFFATAKLEGNNLYTLKIKNCNNC